MTQGGSRGEASEPVARVRLCVAPREWLADLAGIRPNAVRIVTGAAARDKLVDVRGVEIASLRGLLDAAGGK